MDVARGAERLKRLAAPTVDPPYPNAHYLLGLIGLRRAAGERIVGFEDLGYRASLAHLEKAAELGHPEATVRLKELFGDDPTTTASLLNL